MTWNHLQALALHPAKQGLWRTAEAKLSSLQCIGLCFQARTSPFQDRATVPPQTERAAHVTGRAQAATGTLRALYGCDFSGKLLLQAQMTTAVGHVRTLPPRPLQALGVLEVGRAEVVAGQRMDQS